MIIRCRFCGRMTKRLHEDCLKKKAMKIRRDCVAAEHILDINLYQLGAKWS